MLLNLVIKNIALINELEICFDSGLCILSGETGAGKTIIIDAINFLAGSRPTKDLLRVGANQGFVGGLFVLTNEEALVLSSILDAEITEEAFLSRSLNSDGRTVCKINGQIVPVNLQRLAASFLMDIHSQRGNQSLFDSKKHIILVDRFAGKEIEILKSEAAEQIEIYKKIKKRLGELTGPSGERERRMETLKAQISEIKRFSPKPNEDIILREKLERLRQSENLSSNVRSAIRLLHDSGGNAPAVMDLLSRATAPLKALSEIDPKIAPLYENFLEQREFISILTEELLAYSRKLDSEPARLEAMEARYDELYRLSKKYGGDVANVLAFLDEAQNQLADLENAQLNIEELNKEREKQTRVISEICARMSETRKRYAQIISKGITENLIDLGMNNALFDINIQKTQLFSVDGNDKLEFTFSANLGEELKPLARIASGGETSRVMLALKSVLAEADDVPTLVFDEIDAGVSGRAAQAVGQKLSKIAKKRQILCITHLPQIAAFADAHFLIEKRIINGETLSNVISLNEEGATDEISRLIGGAKITEATKKAAREMRELAQKIKKNGL